MEKNHSLLILVVVMAVLFGLTACGSQSKQDIEPQGQAGAVEPVDAAEIISADTEDGKMSTIEGSGIIGEQTGQGEEEETLSGKELLDLFEMAYEECKQFDLIEEYSIQLELEHLKSYVGLILTNKVLPADYEERYLDWRPMESEDKTNLFTEVNETVYATGTVNIRDSYNADSEKLGSLNRGQSITRTGTGTGDADGWSKVEFNGQTAYISSQYLSTTKPSTPTTGQPTPSTGQTSTGQSTPTTGTSSGGQQSTSGSSSIDDLIDQINQGEELPPHLRGNGEIVDTEGRGSMADDHPQYSGSIGG